MGSKCPFRVLTSVFLPHVFLSALRRRRAGSPRFDERLREGVDGWKNHKSLPKTLADALGDEGWKSVTDDKQVVLYPVPVSIYEGATHYIIHEEHDVRLALAAPGIRWYFPT